MAAKHRTWWLVTIFVLGAAVLIPNSAWADDDAEPPRVKMKVKVRKAHDKPGRDPMATAHKWMMKEMARHMKAMGDAEGEAAKSPLHYWFATKDVPLAGLRDAFKADGWTADELMKSMHQHFMHTMMQMMGGGGPGMFDLGGMMGAMRPGGPAVRFRRMHRGGPRGNTTWGGRGPRMGPGPMGSGRSIIIWNDGSGWRTQGMPGGMRGGGMGMGGPRSWTRFGEEVEPGARRRGPARGPRGGAQGLEQMIEQLRRLQRQFGGGDAAAPRPPAPPRPPMPPGGMRGGMRPPNMHGANPEQMHNMLRHLQKMLKEMPIERGEMDMQGAQLDELIKQLMRMVPHEHAAPAAKKKPGKRKKVKGKKKPEKKLEDA